MKERIQNFDPFVKDSGKFEKFEASEHTYLNQKRSVVSQTLVLNAYQLQLLTDILMMRS